MKDPWSAFEKEEKPEELTEKEKERDINILIQKEKVSEYIKLERKIKNNVRKLYGFIWGQCTPSLQTSVKHLAEYKEKSNDYDVIWLLKELKNSHPAST